jgi:hypothetical protein
LTAHQLLVFNDDHQRAEGKSDRSTVRRELVFPTVPQERRNAMRLLFSLKNKMSQQKSLKAHAWYIWY